MSDINPGRDVLRLENDASPPVREGLPPGYRMRADAHYVDQLDSPLLHSPVRFLEIHGLDASGPEGHGTLSAAFIESIRRHGVLQPLMVRSHGGRHQVIAGRKRLAAARAAGLSRVPCLIERVDDEQAPLLAAATNTPAVDAPVARSAAHASPPVTASAQPPQATPATNDVTFAAFVDCLTAVASSANLLTPGPTLTQTAAVELVRAEAARALHLLLAARVLQGEVSVTRREVAVRTLLERAVEQTAAERRLRGVSVDMPPRQGSETVLGDEELLSASLSALILAPAVLIEAPRSKAVSLRVHSRGGGTVMLSAVHDGADIPYLRKSDQAAKEWPDLSTVESRMSSSALVLLRAARRIAELHGGHMTLDCSDGRTTVSMVVPVARV